MFKNELSCLILILFTCWLCSTFQGLLFFNHEHQCSRLLNTKSVMQISGCQSRDEGLPENHRGALDMLESNKCTDPENLNAFLSMMLNKQ